MSEEIFIPDSAADALQFYRSHPQEEESYVLLILCEKGSFRLVFGRKPLELHPGDLFICPPGQSIVAEEAGEDSSIRYMCIRLSSFLRSIRTGRNVWNVLMYALKQPVFHLSADDAWLTSCYYQVIKGKLATRRSYYFDEIMASLVQCAIYEVCVILNRDIGAEQPGQGSHRDEIFKRFLDLLSADGGRHRQVRYYADELYVTPKYLSGIISEICDTTAQELILDSASKEIRQTLEFSNLSIKEIATDFGFPDVSAFGKFVKSRLGYSPRSLRRRLR